MPFVGPRRRAAHKNAVDAAVKAGADRIVYTSIVGAGEKDIDTYEVNDHVWTEAYMSAQPIHHLFMRDSQYAEAMVSNYVNALENTGGVLANNMGDGKMAFISRDDCAVAAAYAAMSDWSDRVVDVNGPELLTIADYLAIASEVTGKKVTYRYIDDDAQYAFFDSIGVPRTTEEMWADSAKNFPFCSDGMVTFGRAIRLGQMATFTNDFEELVGRKPITVKEIFEHMDEHLIGTRTSTEDQRFPAAHQRPLLSICSDRRGLSAYGQSSGPASCSAPSFGRKSGRCSALNIGLDASFFQVHAAPSHKHQRSRIADSDKPPIG